jgi:hypothetical protein
MINLKKQDNVADAVNEILQQEALKGNQHKIDKNKNNKIDPEDFRLLRKEDNVDEALKGNQHLIDKNKNNKVDPEDFKILRGEKKVKEEIDMNDRTKDTLVGREKTKQKDDVGPNSNAKVSKFKLKSEEAEQIDEKNVPTSPEKWAQAKSAAKSKFAVYPSAYANGWASKKYKSMGGGWRTEEVEQQDEATYNHKKAMQSQNPRIQKKGIGGAMDNAAKRIQQTFKDVPRNSLEKSYKEEVEQIDELSKSTLGSYLDKKKSEYMKGKTQSGSKENAKDIQNMGKAHDKMKKEETQFNDHEKGAAQRLRDMRKNEKEAEKMDKQYQAMRNKKTLKQMKERLEEPILDELIYEVMSQDASAGDYIHDFIHSDNPKFAGKSDAKRKEMALAAYYSKKNEEAVNEGLKDMAKKTFKALTGGSDKDHLDRLKKDMYGGSEVKYAAKTLVKHAKDPLGLKKEEAELEEGWDDMVKAAQEKVKSGPKPSGGSGKKEGSRYGGSKQKEKPEQDVKEGKDPMMDAGVGSQPNFVTDSAKPMQHAQSLAKKSLAKMRSDMMAKKSK